MAQRSAKMYRMCRLSINVSYFLIFVIFLFWCIFLFVVKCVMFCDYEEGGRLIKTKTKKVWCIVKDGIFYGYEKQTSKSQNFSFPLKGRCLR